METTAAMVQAIESPVVSFFTLVPGCRAPQRADPSAAGTMPTRAFRHCEALRAAASFGWYVFPPISFSLLWDGTDVIWTYEGAESWFPLTVAQFPGFADQFDAAVPADIKTYAPPFLAKFREPDIVQIWSGLIARTMPGWSLLVRQLANLPKSQGYELYEGIVETDRWFGPLFTNLRLTRTDVPIEFNVDFPFLQVQPLPQNVYADDCMRAFTTVTSLADMEAADWQAYHDTVVQPCSNPDRQQGRYGAAARRRRKKRV